MSPKSGGQSNIFVLAMDLLSTAMDDDKKSEMQSDSALKVVPSTTTVHDAHMVLHQ